MARVRLDDELVRQGVCPDRDEALRLLMSGAVSAGGERLTSPGMLVRPGIELHVKGQRPYVGRGGLKLSGALDAFGVDPAGLFCVDVGCSTGGFTDCLLQRGAARVLAVDVGRAQFAWQLRNDARVTLLERTNIVDVPALGYAGAFDLAVCDVSFTCVGRVLPAVLELLGPAGGFLTLVKPQFEVLRSQVDEGGVVRSAAARAAALEGVIRQFARSGLEPADACVSPILGAKGNTEFFLLGVRARLTWDARELDARVEELVQKAGAR